ncbi:MAG TPA: response regulator, partial [Streptosporangiaceae bacterium]|nr:response regulator [Streptosporangiaceae bacterium]
MEDTVPAGDGAGRVAHAAPPSGRPSLARVLVVEDDSGIATQMVRGLARAGYEAEQVATGADALLQTSADVVLLDLGLPDIDGIEVCRQLRARSDAAIIVVTARGEEGDRVLA